MIKEKRLNLIGQLLLLGATLVWGTSFFILKDTISEYPSMYIIGLRFLASALIIGLIFIKRILKLNKGTFSRGVMVGLCLAGAYLTQTYGLEKTSPSTNAFLTSLYCVICPFLFWLFYKMKPKSYNVISMGLCVIGLSLVAFSGGEETGNEFIGCFLTIVSAVFYALQIVFNYRFQNEKDDTFQLIFTQILTAGVVIFIVSLIFEFPVNDIKTFIIKKEHIFNVIYLTVACTVFAQLAQILGQKWTTPAQVTIILSLESVFGALFSVLLGGERLTLMLLSGFIIIFISVMITELKIDFAKLFSKREKE